MREKTVEMFTESGSEGKCMGTTEGMFDENAS